MDANTKDVLVLLITGLPAALAAYYAYRASLRGAQNSARLDLQSVNIEKIEKATNSMKDALVSSTAREKHAAGMAEERSEQRMREGERAIGAIESQKAKVVEKVVPSPVVAPPIHATGSGHPTGPGGIEVVSAPVMVVAPPVVSPPTEASGSETTDH